jgi:hypothetical protein
MEVHRLGMSRRWQRDLEDANEFVLEDHLMAAGSSLHRVEAIGKAGLILPVEDEVPGAQQQNAHGYNGDEGKPGSTHSLACRLHAAQYIPAKRRC